MEQTKPSKVIEHLCSPDRREQGLAELRAVVVEDQGFDQFLLLYGDLFSALDGCLKEERVEELAATLEVLIDLSPMLL